MGRRHETRLQVWILGMLLTTHVCDAETSTPRNLSLGSVVNESLWSSPGLCSTREILLSVKEPGRLEIQNLSTFVTDAGLRSHSNLQDSTSASLSLEQLAPKSSRSIPVYPGSYIFWAGDFPAVEEGDESICNTPRKLALRISLKPADSSTRENLLLASKQHILRSVPGTFSYTAVYSKLYKNTTLQLDLGTPCLLSIHLDKNRYAFLRRGTKRCVYKTCNAGV